MRRTLSYQGGSDEQWNENVGRDRGGNVSVGNSHSVRLGRRRASLRGGSHAMGMARHGMSSHGGMTSHVLHSLLRNQSDLGLTEDQVTKLKALALDQDRAQIRTHADVQVANRELRALVTDEKTELSV